MNTFGLALATLSLAAAAMPVKAAGFTLASSDIKPGQRIDMKHVFNGFGCAGGNLSPALAWSGAPKGTKSFALLVHDADAPTGGAGWWHWVVYDIPASATALAQGAGTAAGDKLPKGAAQGATDFGAAGWGGPCPPAGHGTHHYVFTLYALGTDKLDVPANATASLIGFAVNANAIGKATLMGTFSVPKTKP